MVGLVRIVYIYLVPQEASRSQRTLSVTTKAEEASEHDDKQEDVRNKRDSHGDPGGLEVDRRAGASKIVPSIAELLKGKQGMPWISKIAFSPAKHLEWRFSSSEVGGGRCTHLE